MMSRSPEAAVAQEPLEIFAFTSAVWIWSHAIDASRPD